MLVFIDDIQRDILRHCLNGLCIRDLQQNGIACFQLEAFGDLFSIAEHMALCYKSLQSTAGKAGILAA